jgi:replicative superfamily II helicase
LEEHQLLPVKGTIEDKFRGMFPFKDFNRMQSIAVPVILHSDDNVVVSAPTASGKTVLAEAAMIKELGKPDKGKVLFIAPLRALTNEKEGEWKRVLGDLGFKVYVVTGERELHVSEARSADVIITTPEKWDSATRKYEQERYSFVKETALVVIDEVHLLDSDTRGGTLEAIVSRMRRISAECGKRFRIVALSATMPNIRDVAQWIGAPEPCTLIFDGSYRPVELETDVLPYYPKDNDFLNKYIRLYKAFDLIKHELGDGHQALIFVATRQDTAQAAEKLCEVMRKNNPYSLAPFEAIKLQEIRNRVNNTKLKACIPCGVAFHHAGLSMEDKAAVEAGFREGLVRVLVSTSTLAWGVNLPARVVVVRDTEMYDPIAGMKDISPIDLLQMLGRAGRPGYDTMGVGYVIVPSARVREYKDLLKGGKPIESMLKFSLCEHLNAEIAVGMVHSVAEAIDWLKTTFYYVRALRDPSMGVTNIDAMMASKVDYLVRNGFVKSDSGTLSPTSLGTITSDFYLKLETALMFKEYSRKGSLSTEDVLDIVSRAAEFSDVVSRPGEASSLRANGFDSSLGGSAKVRAILMGFINKSVPDELKSDAWAIKQNASRLLGAFARFCEEFSGTTLSRKVKMVSVQIDKGVPDEAVTLASIDGVGERSMEVLMKNGIRSLRDAADRKPEDLIRMGIRGQLAIEIVEASQKLPRIEADLSALPKASGPGHIQASISLKNVGAAGTIAVAVKVNERSVVEERFYLANGSVRQVPLELEMRGDDIHVRVAADYVDSMLPVDEWKTTVRAVRESVRPAAEKEKTADVERFNMNDGTFYVIAGDASVEYTGRAHDTYTGSVVVMIKPDSSVVVNTDKGVLPHNYMGKANVSGTRDENGMKILAESNGERLYIAFDKVALMQAPFNGSGTERDTPVEKIESRAKEKMQKPEMSESDQLLEKALRAMRTAKSQESGLPPYTIFADRTLYDLILKKPATKEELLDIYGIGAAKAEKYGDMILQILKDRRQEA